MCTVTLKIRPEWQRLWMQLWNSLSLPLSLLFLLVICICAEIPPLCSSPKYEIILSDKSASNIIRNAISVIPMNLFVTGVCLGLQLSHEGQDSIIGFFYFFIESVEKDECLGSEQLTQLQKYQPALQRTRRHRYSLNSA